MTTASHEDHFEIIGHRSDFVLRARRVQHRAMSYPGQIWRVALGKFGAVLIGVLEAGNQSGTKESDSRDRNPTALVEVIQAVLA